VLCARVAANIEVRQPTQVRRAAGDMATSAFDRARQSVARPLNTGVVPSCDRQNVRRPLVRATIHYQLVSDNREKIERKGLGAFGRMYTRPKKNL
jgi:hypothetical protein